MADQAITLPTGQKLDVSEVTVAGQPVERERNNLADPTDPLGIAKVQNAAPAATDYGVAVRPIGLAPGTADSAVATALPVLGRVTDAVDQFIADTVRMLSLATDGRLRVVTAKESDNFAAWGDPEHFESALPELHAHHAW